MIKKRVFVAMSGGVDSSVSAFLLKEAGFDVTGVFIQGWYPDFIQCNWKDEKRDAMRVAAQLNIPFLTIDAEMTYKTEVVDYMVREYSVGRTPNPDVMCNRHVKFGIFFDEAMRQGADYIATGHYARVEHEEGGSVLKSGVDSGKDQTYFLWNIQKQTLERTLFPIGHLKKAEVREIAIKNKFINATKKDSQGVCFLGKISMKDFLKHFIKTERGDVLDTEGNVIGYHDGALLFTLGERRGFTITEKGTDDAPRYVVSKDVHTNTITVSEKNEKALEKFAYNEVAIVDTNWISGELLDGEGVEVRFRHLQRLRKAQIKKVVGNNKNNHWGILFDEPQEAVSSGQSLVVYRDNECLGGGIIV
jgi:tRNA-uridine 2-sulfurtransferase